VQAVAAYQTSGAWLLEQDGACLAAAAGQLILAPGIDDALGSWNQRSDPAAGLAPLVERLAPLLDGTRSGISSAVQVRDAGVRVASMRSGGHTALPTGETLPGTHHATLACAGSQGPGSG
jgi:hypothetical protein